MTIDPDEHLHVHPHLPRHYLPKENETSNINRSTEAVSLVEKTATTSSVRLLTQKLARVNVRGFTPESLTTSSLHITNFHPGIGWMVKVNWTHHYLLRNTSRINYYYYYCGCVENKCCDIMKSNFRTFAADVNWRLNKYRSVARIACEARLDRSIKSGETMARAEIASFLIKRISLW